MDADLEEALCVLMKRSLQCLENLGSLLSHSQSRSNVLTVKWADMCWGVEDSLGRFLTQWTLSTL